MKYGVVVQKECAGEARLGLDTGHGGGLQPLATEVADEADAGRYNNDIFWRGNFRRWLLHRAELGPGFWHIGLGADAKTDAR